MDGISCVCPTYSRVELLEESIECFLKQDYEGPKELLILNDYPEQTLIFDHPDITIINTQRRFKTLGEKRDATIALSKYEWYAVWDDDDIYLPHRLSFSMNKIKKHKLEYYKLNTGFFTHLQKGIEKIDTNQFFGSCIFSRKLFENVGSHGCINFGEDVFFEKKINDCDLNKKIENNVNVEGMKLKDIYYLYRWGGIGGHVSGVGNDPNRLERGRKTNKKGEIILNPHWRWDYLKESEEFIKNLNKKNYYEK